MRSPPVLIVVYAYAPVGVPDRPAQPHPVALRRERLARQAQHARRGRR